MYTTHIKRTVILFIACFTMFSLCFTMHISATTPSESTENTSTDTLSSEEVSQDPSSQGASSEEPTDSSTEDSEAVSTESTDSVVSDESSQESIESGESSVVDSEVYMSSVPISSGEVSSLVVEQVSQGGAPDATYESEWNAKQSYVYEGSYAGLSSETASEAEKQEIQTTNQSSTAQRYARYAKIGMIVFGLLTIGCIAFLIYYNMKVKKSKKLHPEWYPKKDKVVPKHGKH